MATNNQDDVIQIEKLKDSENFMIWKFQVTIVFKSLGLYDIVTGVLALAEGMTEQAKAEWIRKDARAQKIIITSIEKQPLTHVLVCKTSQEMFQRICAMYERDTEQQKCILLQEFFNFSYQKGTDIATHVSKLENLAYRLKVLNADIDDSMLMSKILVTLPPEKYKHFACAWESTAQDQKTLSNLTSRLLSEENRLSVTDARQDAVAFKATEKKCHKCNNTGHLARACKVNKGNIQDMRCFKCNGRGHIAKFCKKEDATGGTTKCNICKKSNHAEKDCYFRKNKTDDQTSTKDKVTFLASNCKTNKWILDSGSSSHITNDKNMFKNMRKIESEIGTAKKSQILKAEGIGTVETDKCVLNKVLYVKDLSKNLLSVNEITKNGGKVIFTKEKAEIWKDNIKLIGFRNGDGLWTVNLNQESMDSALLTRENKMAIQWHQKLGHLGKENMKKLQNISEGMKITDKSLDVLNNVCETCLKAKQTRIPFGEKRTRAKRPLEIVHTDVCGPIDPITWDKKKYMITFIDDFTHFVMVYLIEGKYEVADTVKEYANQVETKWNLKISKLRCDNGREYVNEELKIWCRRRGTILDVTTPYTPQLNGKAERMNRTLIEKTRALLTDAQIDKSFWGEAVRTAAYLTNRSPTDAVKGTPLENWTSQKPDLTRLHIFGCNAYTKTLTPLKKLDDRCKSYIFVGYAPNGYRLYDEERRKIVISRDVKFKEEITSKNKSAKINIHAEEEQTEKQEEIENNMENISGSEEEYQDADLEIEEEESQEETQEDTQEEQEELGRGKRKRKIPDRYKDYVYLTYIEATTGPDKENWKKAIEEEKKSLEENNTWKTVDRTEAKSKKILSNKWVFKIKDDGRYKARLVVRGCEQRHGIDYEETFSPVVNSSSLRTLLAIATKRRDYIVKFDIKTAFLYGNLDEEIFMELPDGYNCNNKICRLNKALYGLKQAPLRWNQRFTTFLKTKGLKPTKAEPCIYRTDDNTLILAIYVDDGLIIGQNRQSIDKLLSNLGKEFHISVFKDIKSFLGIEIQQDKEGLKLLQLNYADHVVKMFNMENSKPVNTPILINDDRSEEINEVFPYRESVGSILYLSSKTRPDLAYAAGYASRHLDKPYKQDVANIKRILRYINATKNLGISYKVNNDKNKEELIGYTDSDYAGDVETRKSTTGFIIMYCNGPISWCSKKQSVVALSSTEAEYIAATECCKEILYLKFLIEELTGKSVKATLNIDNQSTIHLIKNGIGNKRSKHIDIRYRFINEKVAEGLISVNYCSTDTQLADIFTKALGQNKFEIHKKRLLN